MYFEFPIKPKNKKQQKEFDRYVKFLNLQTEGEKFILLCVLSFDWDRRKILQNIKYIEESEDKKYIKFDITMTAPNITTVYSTGNPFNGNGWSLEKLDERLWYTYHQMDYYTTP